MMALTQEDLKAIENLFDKKMDEKLMPIQQEQAKTNARLTKMQKDVAHIREQVDIAYNWVDGIDLRVKALERG